MGDIWWDIFCPNCGEHVHGDTCNAEEEFKKQQDEFRNSAVHCDGCGIDFDFETDKIIDRK